MTDFFKTYTLEQPNYSFRSIVWEGDSLVDWVGGGHRFLPDGNFAPANRYFPYRFDRAIGSPSCQYAVVFENLGTKGLLAKNGRDFRQIDRDYAHAGSYEFPVTTVRLSSGIEALIHCPGKYNRLAIEEIESGERIGTPTEERKYLDFFHSRLIASPSGKHLISLGWHWHPWQTIRVYDLDAAVLDNSALDGGGIESPINCEVFSAHFVDDETIVFEFVDEETNDRKLGLGVWKFLTDTDPLILINNRTHGLLHALGPKHALAFYEHPRLLSLETGETLFEWTDINSGEWNGCFSKETINPVAFDRERARFAIINQKTVDVVEIDLKRLPQMD